MSSTTLLRRNSSNASPKIQRRQINSMIAGDPEKYMIQQQQQQNKYSNIQQYSEPTNTVTKSYLTNKIDVEYLNEKLRKLQSQNETIPENFNSNNVIKPRCIVIHRSKSNSKRSDKEQQQVNFHHQTRKENDRSVSSMEHHSNLHPVRIQYNEKTNTQNKQEVEEARNVSNLKCNLVRSTHRDLLRNRNVVIHNQNSQQRAEQPIQTNRDHKTINRSQSQLAYNPIAHITKTQSFNNNPNELLKSYLNSNNNNNNNKQLPKPTFKTSHSFHLDLNSYANKSSNTSTTKQNMHSSSSSSSETADRSNERETVSDLDEHRSSSKERDSNGNNDADDDNEDEEDFEKKCSTVTQKINDKLNRHLSVISNANMNMPQRAIVIRREKTVSTCTINQPNKNGNLNKQNQQHQQQQQQGEKQTQIDQDKQKNLEQLRKSLTRESIITMFNNKETASSTTSGIEVCSSKNSPTSRTVSDETHSNVSANMNNMNGGSKFDTSIITDSIVGSSVSSSAGSFKFNESERHSTHNEQQSTSTSPYLNKINELRNRLFVMEVELKNEKKKLILEKDVKSKLLFEMKNRYESEKQAALQALEAKLNAEKLFELNKLKEAYETEKREEFDMSQKSFDSELLNLKVKLREKSEKCQQLEKMLKEEHNKNAGLFAKSMEVVRKYNDELKNLNQLKQQHQQEMDKKQQVSSIGTQTMSNSTNTTGLQTSLVNLCSETLEQQQQTAQATEAVLKKHILHIKSLFSCTNLNHKHQEQQTLTSHLVDIELLVKHTLKIYANLKNEFKTVKEANENVKLELDELKEAKCKLESLYKIKCKSDLNKSACIKKLQINYDCELIKLRNDFNNDLVKFLEYKLNTKDSMIIDYFNHLEYWLQLLSPSDKKLASSRDNQVLLYNIKKVKESIENLLKSNLAHSFTLINNNPHQVEMASNLNSLINGSYKRMPINLIINSNNMSSDSFCNEISSHENQNKNSLKINVENQCMTTCETSTGLQALSNLEQIRNNLKKRANDDTENLNRFNVSHVMSHSLSNHTNRSNNTTEFTSSHSLFEASDSLNNQNNEINNETVYDKSPNANNQNEFIQYIQVHSNNDQEYGDEEESEQNEYDDFSDQHEQTNQHNQTSALSPFSLYNVINSQVPMKYLNKSISLVNLPTHTMKTLTNKEQTNDQDYVQNAYADQTAKKTNDSFDMNSSSSTNIPNAFA